MNTDDCIVNYWPQAFRDLYGGVWPSNYVCVDCETTGYDVTRDVITEWGHCLVEDGKPTNKLSVVIDWTGHDVVPDHWLRSRLAAVQQGMVQSGRTCSVSYERMQSEGLKPRAALEFIRDFCSTIRGKGIPFVAHNAMFDEKMVCANLFGFDIAKDFSFGDNGYIDTEAIEKANQLLDNERCHPKATDTLRSYFNRVRGTRVTGVYSNLDKHCFTKYGFAEKHGLSLADMHGAATDSYCCHLLMEVFRGMLVDEIKPAPFFTGASKSRTASAAVPAVAFVPSRRIRGQRRS